MTPPNNNLIAEFEERTASILRRQEETLSAMRQARSIAKVPLMLQMEDRQAELRALAARLAEVSAEGRANG